MDPVTHGITGALLGKGYFADKHGSREERVAIFAATLGAVVPDIDTVADALSRDPLAIIKYHRGITHSLLALPFFAVALAWLTRLVARKLKIEAPSWGMLTLIYGIGIASHILLDGMTSFGTRMLTPLSQKRVAWDLLFIIDLTFSSIVLLPQITAWIYRDRAKSRSRAIKTWILLAVAAIGGWALAAAVGYPFHVWVLLVAILVIAALFFLPSRSTWGFSITRSAWCRAGFYTLLLYVAFCWMAHHAVISRVKEFAAENHIEIERIGALPLPPSWLSWGGVIRTANGVYQSRFDIRHLHPQSFDFIADSQPNEYVDDALQLPEVKTYWGFARFPVIRSSTQEGLHIVEFGENRFVNPKRRRPQPFTYVVVFDSNGNVVEEGWEQNGMFMENLARIPHHGVSP